MELFLLYMWLKINTIIFICCVSGVVGLASSACCCGIASDYPSTADKWFRRARKFLIISPILLFIAGVIPSKTDIAILVGASVALDMAKSPEGIKVGTLLRGKVNEVLDEAIKEMTPKTETKK